MLANIIEKQSWAGPMEVVDDDAFNRFAAKSPAVVYRGVRPDGDRTAEVMQREFLDQDVPHIGEGVNGYGWYTTDKVGTANVYGGAASGSAKRGTTDRSAIGSTVVELAFRKDANIRYITKTADRRDDLGEYSAQLGYDAVAIPGTTPGETYHLLLNRSAVVARRMRQ